MERKRIVMIGPSLRSRGGIASVCAEYQRAGLLDRLNVDYLSSYESASALTRMAVAARAALVLGWKLLRRRVALVHVHMASGTSIWRKLAYCSLARLAGVPYVIHLHSGKFSEYFEQACGPRRRRLIASAFAGAARLLVLAEERLQWLRRQGLDAVPVEILPNMVALPRGRGPQQGSDLLFLGRLEEAKGVSTLLRAFARVHGQFPGVALLLGGEGDRSRYEAEVASLGLGRAVRFLGWIDGDAKLQVFEQAAVFVLPSRYEGLPMGVLEAMSWRLPCVATSVGGVPDIITDGVNGRLVDVDDVAGLAATLDTLLATPTLRRELGDAARRTVEERYSAAAIESQLARIYQEVTPP